MPPLDPKDEAIVQACVACGGNQTEAWRITHPNSKASAKTQQEKASRFFAQGKVRARLLELHLEVASEISASTKLTLEAHLEKLRELREEARERGQMSAAIQAEKLRGEASRFYVRQVETGEAGDFARMSDEELRAYVYGTSDELPPKGETKH